MSDLIAKLRAEHPADFQGCDPSFDLRQEAADEIEWLAGLLNDKQYLDMKARYAKGEKSWANMINEREARNTGK